MNYDVLKCRELFWQFMRGEITLAELEDEIALLGLQMPLFDEIWI